jgi:hypothetical protein
MKRKIVKIIHSLAACGMIGALMAYLVLLQYGPQDTPSQYADMRKAISVLCDYMLVPAMGIALVSGFISMLAHKPYQQKGWVWVKVLTTIGIFESTMAVVQSKSTLGADVSAKIARGEATPSALFELDREWGAIAVVMTLAVANVLIAIWRPRIEKWGKHTG